jgi:HEAT repeat protein
MKATKHAPEIASLLSDREEEVVGSAIEALSRLNATEYVDRITAIAVGPAITYPRNDLAMHALVEMGAKDQAAKIAKLARDDDSPLTRGRAILCVALLDGKEFTPEIATFVDVEDVREEAIMALEIMRQTQYADQVASFLDSSSDRSKRQAAVWSLVMMESTKHAAAALKAYSEFDMEQSGLLRKTGEASDRRLKVRFEESMKKLKDGLPPAKEPGRSGRE